MEAGAFMPLQLIKPSLMRYSILNRSTASPPPSLDVCLLCEDMFTTIESTLTGQTTL